MLCCSCAALLRAGDGDFQRVRSLPLHIGRNVRVKVEGHRDVGVSKPLLHDLPMHALSKKKHMDRIATNARGNSNQTHRHIVNHLNALGNARSPRCGAGWPDSIVLMMSLVAHRGFEPLISALRGRCPRPLDECAVTWKR
jgi:hypothetical protein